jgi:hypothetical protein
VCTEYEFLLLILELFYFAKIKDLLDLLVIERKHPYRGSDRCKARLRACWLMGYREDRNSIDIMLREGTRIADSHFDSRSKDP